VSGLQTVPGVFREERTDLPRRALATGVPVILGYASGGAVGAPAPLRRLADLAAAFGPPARGYLAGAVAAFFRNGGERCYVVRLDDGAPAVTALAQGLAAALDVDEADLICAPDAVRPRRAPGQPDLPPDPGELAAMQRAILEHCDAVGTRIALLDALPRATTAVVLDQAAGLRHTNGALYYPWPAEDGGWVPPCGHVAGVVSRVDRTRGVHHAPANIALEGVRDVEVAIDDATQATLRAGGVNCLRAFPARGVRVWDALTLSRDAEWAELNVRRLVTTLARWIAQTTRDVAFEPNTPETWARVRRAVTAHLDELFRQGALAGASPDEAYAVDCDGRNNPPELRAAGRLAVDVRLAPAAPIEVVAVRIVRHATGVTVEPVTD
jgi:phage tail sheath protein FI